MKYINKIHTYKYICVTEYSGWRLNENSGYSRNLNCHSQEGSVLIQTVMFMLQTKRWVVSMCCQILGYFTSLVSSREHMESASMKTEVS